MNVYPLRKGLFCILGAAAILTCFVPVNMADAKAKKPHIVFVTGDDEYRSEVTMPLMAEILQRGRQFKCTVLYAVNPDTGQPDAKYQKNIPGLEVLKQADLAVIYLRFRALPDEQLKYILDYVNSGKPIVGLRTSTHAFRYPRRHENAKYNDGFGREVFGQKWITHHGHKSRTDAWVIADKADHPLLRGIYATQKSPIRCSSWLYHVTPLVGDCEPLMMGRSINSNKAGTQDKYPLMQPVAWTKTYKGARVFFTTLGHPKDFEDHSVRRLLANGIQWALGMDVPQGGASVEARSGLWGFTAPETH